MQLHKKFLAFYLTNAFFQESIRKDNQGISLKYKKREKRKKKANAKREKEITMKIMAPS